jgi:hypothetical protein
VKARRIFISIFTFALSSCGSPQQPTTITQDPNANYLPSNTVSFVQSSPTHNTVEVPLDTTVRIQFSGPVDGNSLKDGINIFVIDDVKHRMPGVVSYDSSTNAVIWRPQIDGRNVYLNKGTAYTVYLKGVKDASGLYIADWDFRFFTKKAVASTGRFHIIYLGKQRKDDGSPIDAYEHILLPSMAIEVQFSEPVNMEAAACSTTMWSDAFQIVDADLGNFIGVAGQVCPLCRAGGICDTLRFMPAKPWIDGSVLNVTVRPTAQLEGMSHEPLQAPQSANPLSCEENCTRLWVFPNLANIFK